MLFCNCCHCNCNNVVILVKTPNVWMCASCFGSFQVSVEDNTVFRCLLVCRCIIDWKCGLSVSSRPKTACATTCAGRWMRSWYSVNVTVHLSISDIQTKTTGRWVRFSESGGTHWKPRRRNSIMIWPTRFESLRSALTVTSQSAQLVLRTRGAT